jgi:hypothetical protein
MLPRECCASRDPLRRSGLRIGLEDHILLEDVPIGVTGAPKLSEQVSDARGALTEWSEETGPHRIVVGKRAGAYTFSERRVDILQVHVPHARPGVARDVDGIGAAKSDMAGVQAQRVCATVEESSDVMGALDRRAPMRVDDDQEPARACDVSQAIEALEKGAPGAIGQIRRRAVADLTGGRRQHEDLASGRGEPIRLPGYKGDLSRKGRGIVKNGSDEAADQADATRPKELTRGRGLHWEKSLWTGFRRVDA